MLRTTPGLIVLCTLCVPDALPAGAADGLCTQWSAPTRLGDLDVKIIKEASGIAVSRGAARLYHINDGSTPDLFVTDTQGGALQTVRIAGFAPQDMEDIALGPCGTGNCLYVADIGDNAVRRASLQIALIRETPAFGAEVKPERVVVARYPDGPHDAEAIAVHPSGDLLLATKVRLGQKTPSQLYRLRAAQLAAGGEQTFEAMGAIPVSALSAALGEDPRRIVTSMDIAPDGRRFVLLTYDAAIEFAVDLRQGLPATWTEGTTHRATRIATLLQSEAVAYDRDGRSLLYTTESLLGTAAPLMRQACQE